MNQSIICIASLALIFPGRAALAQGTPDGAGTPKSVSSDEVGTGEAGGGVDVSAADPDASPGKPLSKEEVLKEMKSPAFQARVEACIFQRYHPDALWLNIEISPDGTSRITSIEPTPASEVWLCMAEAASVLKFRATEKGTTIKFPYSLPPPHFTVNDGWGEAYPAKSPEPQPKPPSQSQPQAEPPPQAGTGPSTQQPWSSGTQPARPPQALRFPGGKRFGFGLFANFVVLDRAKNVWESGLGEYEETWYGQFTGGLGLFGEYLPNPHFAIGLELDLVFPYVKEFKQEGRDRMPCNECEQDIIVRLLVRAKIPVNVNPGYSFYPLVLFGYSDYIQRQKDYDAVDHHGVGFGLGFGAEVFFKKVTELFELRYMLDAGWSGEIEGYDEKHLLNHNLSLIVGLRIP